MSVKKIFGEELNREWNVNAKHALASSDSKWYNNLERFPGALFDPNGYILFETEEEYRNCQYLKIGVRTNVEGEGISQIPGYVKMIS